MSSGFITETEIVEIKKRRQEEWEKVRKAEDPLERPEEPCDNRSLYDRLQEQKQKKDLEYEEAHKLKNIIKGLDDDEIEFLNYVNYTKNKADRIKELEEERELMDYRNRVSLLQKQSKEEKLQTEIVVNKTKREKQPNPKQKLLKGVVIKKSETQKRKMSDTDCVQETAIKRTAVQETGETSGTKELPVEGLKCIAILPGIGCYQDSSSENEDSSDDDVETKPHKKIDLLGRKIEKKEGTPGQEKTQPQTS